MVGDAVSVRVPRIDRAATDLHRLPCIVAAQHGDKHFQYRLQCKYGLLESSYPESELEAFGGALQMSNIHDWKDLPVVSLREAARSANPSNAFYGAVCHCKKGCSGKQCSCRKAGKPCSTKCHSGRSCVNCHDSNPEREPMVKRIKIDHTESDSELCMASPAKSVDSNLPSPAQQSPVYIGSSPPSPSPPSDWWVTDLFLKVEDK